MICRQIAYRPIADSYHGLAAEGENSRQRIGASCHGMHNIFRSSDPRSTVNSANLGKTAASATRGGGGALCHWARARADQRRPQSSGSEMDPLDVLGVDPVHAGFMLLHNLLDLLAKLIRRRPRQETSEVAVRMNLGFRIAHWGVMASFPTLVVTGFALKYPESWWARPLSMWESNPGLRGGLHRTAAIVLIAATLYHFIHLALKKGDRRFLTAMIPTIKDATDILDVFRYNLGFHQGRAEIREVQLCGKNGVLGLSVGHGSEWLSPAFCCGQQFHVAAFPQVGGRRRDRRGIGMKRLLATFSDPDLALFTW